MTDVHLPGYQPTTEGNAKQIRQAAKALAAARRPVLYVGGGVIAANASDALLAFARSDRFPVTCTLNALGAFPAPDPQWLGMLGMHGTRTANYAMDEADLICAIGARFDDRITGKLSEFAPRAKFIHIDIDPAEISKNIPAHIPIVGDAKNVLERLVVEYRALDTDSGRLEEWWQRLHQWQAQHPLKFELSTSGEIMPQQLIKTIAKITDGDAILCSDVGQHQMWAAQYYDFPAAAPLDQLRRPGDDGLRPAGRDRRPARGSGPAHRRDQRRRLDPDEHPGARDRAAGGPAAEDRRS